MTKQDKILQEKTNGFFFWLQSFTKILVSIFSIVYVGILIFLLYVICVACIQYGSTDAVGVMISEINETFRIVIGGYLIKAGVENTFKIGGSFFEESLKKRLDAKLKLKELDKEEDDIPSDDIDEDAEG